MQPESQGDWGEYRRLILQELSRLHDGIGEVKMQISALHSSDIARLNARMSVLEFKAGVWGLIAGAIPATGALIYMVMSKP